ncbi:MAG TPA: guanylate kinase [Flavobacteriaceae bacterium]|nr:guanylate kinase [Flavobacteriaceae bacterium]
MNKKGKLIVFSAPSGSGKTTIVHHLLSFPELKLDFSISATSRPSRGKEIDGKDYYFISADQFKNHIENNDFVEWEEVYHNNFYGTLKSEIKRIWSNGKNVIFDIDVKGGLNIKKQYPEQTLAIFVQPPSIEEMEIRLRNRQTDTEEKILERVAKAAKEIKFANDFDVILLNDDLEIAKQKAFDLVDTFLKK